MSLIRFSRRETLQFLTTSSLMLPLKKLFPWTESGKHSSEDIPTDDTGTPSIHPKTERSELANPFDGPASDRFEPLHFDGNTTFQELIEPIVSRGMANAREQAPVGEGTAWGIPLRIEKKVLLVKETPISVPTEPFQSEWLFFLHTSDRVENQPESDGLYPPPRRGEGRLREHVADYYVQYDDGTEVCLPIKRRHQIGMFQRSWGVNCIECVAQHKPYPIRAHHEQSYDAWGTSQFRLIQPDMETWTNWLWAWENPLPEKNIVGLRFEPVSGTIVVSAISAGRASSHPLRWQARQKAILSMPEGTQYDPALSEDGLLNLVRLDMGQIISVTPRLLYPNEAWPDTYNNMVPGVSSNELLIEYTAHDDASFHLADGTKIPIADLIAASPPRDWRVVEPALHRVKIRVIDKGTRQPVTVKLHVHGVAGEYLAPEDRHRIPNTAWFEDYSVDFVNQNRHACTYIPGETRIKLPAGKVYIEVSKGFEIAPVRRTYTVTASTEEITIEIEKVLPWREQGWISADTHVHFLSPGSALLEGAGEGVNVVNLLASQWGELMTNVGDFDGKTTYGTRETGGDGEYLVRVGTENRQHVMGHISLLGYEGNIITPLTTGGPDESALGDPIEILLTEWARQCKKQGGLVIIPHFPYPRLEHAVSIVSGDVDGIEMTSWGNLYGGISPYSLSDWYRYFNCGYFVAAVGGTDKMSAGTAVGTVRTYAKIDRHRPFAYASWKTAVRNGNTFVTYGPLVNFDVDGNVPGSWIDLSSSGGTLDVTWKVESVTVPMSRVELVINGEIRESTRVDTEKAEGYWSVKIDKSSWLALLVRGHYADKPEIITAHTSPVMVRVDGSAFFAAADAITILEQIEGTLAYIDTIGTRAEDAVYKRMRLIIESTHRALHNRLHQHGVFHDHTPATDHENFH